MVSIVIPCFNSQATIRKVLESVVNQTYKDYEIIIVDDGSSDNTKSVIEIFFKDKNIKHKYIISKIVVHHLQETKVSKIRLVSMLLF